MSRVCVEHDFPSCYCCLFCSNSNMQCVFCIRENHSNCPDDHILTLPQLKSLPVDVGLFKFSADFQKATFQFNELTKTNTENAFKKLKENINEHLTFPEFIDEDFNSLSIVKTIKQHYLISHKPNSKIINLTPKFNATQIDYKKQIRSFKNNLQIPVSSFLQNVQDVSFQVVAEPFKISHFNSSKNMQVVQLDKNQTLNASGSKTELKPLPNSLSDSGSTSNEVPRVEVSLIDPGNDGLLIYTHPMTCEFLTISVHGNFTEKEETAEFGIFYQKNNSKIVFGKNGSLLPPMSQLISLDSVKANQMNGSCFNVANASNNQFTDGSELFFKFNSNSQVVIFNADYSLNLRKPLLPKTNYYFFVKLNKTKIKLIIS